MAVAAGSPAPRPGDAVSTLRALAPRLLIAVAIVLAALALQDALWVPIRPRAYLFVYPALFFACVLGGLIPGLVATVVSTVGVAYLFLDPRYDIAIASPQERLTIVGFLLMGTTFSFTGEALRTHLQREATARRALQEALAARDEFLSIASHELQTPLSAIRLHLELVSRRVAGDHPKDRTLKNVEHAVQAGARLSRLADDLLDATRAQRGRLQVVRAPTDVTSLVHDVSRRLAPALEEAGCALTVDAEPDLSGEVDPQRLEQVLSNLLTNAARHAPGAPVAVVARRDGGSVRLEVRDQGRGIPPELRERVFERYVGGKGQGGRGGLGLGLYIVRAIVEAHGGDVTVVSEPGSGASFVVRVPGSASPPPA
jgi:signal transduction histidine kinase